MIKSIRNTIPAKVPAREWMAREWTANEIALLRQKYGRVRAAKLAAHLKRSRFSILAQARRQGLHEPRPR